MVDGEGRVFVGHGPANVNDATKSEMFSDTPAPSTSTVRHVCVTCGHSWFAPGPDGQTMKGRMWDTCRVCRMKAGR